MNSEIQITDNRITIQGAKSPLFIRIVLAIIIFINGLIPFVFIFFMLTDGDGLNFVIIVPIIIFWGAGLYLLRVLLWNTYGKEILDLDDSRIQYLADYKFFKDSRKELNTDGLEIEIIYEDKMKSEKGRLRIKNSKNKIETVLQLKLTDLKILTGKIKTRYNN